MIKEQEIVDADDYIQKLLGVIDCALIGSALYLPATANDIDFAVLLWPNVTPAEFCADLRGQGFASCSKYEHMPPESDWLSVRNGMLNLMVTANRKFFDGYVTAMQVCLALHLTDKRDRILVCKIVRDGMTAAQAKAAML